MRSQIQILASKDIDPVKWNDCISRSGNGLIYSTYDYLDFICNNWHGLIVNDYEAVMALPWRKKYGIRYLYQPPFIQQLGVIGTREENFISAIENFCKYGDLLLNYQNKKLADKLKARPKVNLVIDLSAGYTSIAENYKKDLLQNLKKTEKINFQYLKEDRIEHAIDMYHAFYSKRTPHVSENDYRNFKRLCVKLATKGMCFSREVLSGNKLLVASGLFLKDDNRIYNLMNTTTKEGREKEANHFLLDAVIKEFAGQHLFFDFEGSDIPGVKNFYEKFGAVNQPYFHYHFNKLNPLIRLLKR